MGLKFIIFISGLMPALFLGLILYHEFGTVRAPVAETNSGMRVRMCREHLDTAKAEPNNEAARQAVDDCVVAGYLSRDAVGPALD